MIRNGLIPGGENLKRGRQAVFFTTMNSMDDGNGMVENSRDLTKPRIAPYKNTWKRLQTYGMLVQFEARSRERLAIFTKHGHTQSFPTTHCPPFALGKRYVRKRRTELYLKVRLSPRLKRVVLKAKSHTGQQDQRDQDARSSWDPPSKSKSYGAQILRRVPPRTQQVAQHQIHGSRHRHRRIHWLWFCHR